MVAADALVVGAKIRNAQRFLSNQNYLNSSCCLQIVYLIFVTQQKLGSSRIFNRTFREIGVSFRPTEPLIAAASRDNNVYVWNIDFDSWRNFTCFRANRNLTQVEWKQYIGDQEKYDMAYEQNKCLSYFLYLSSEKGRV